MKVVSCDNVHQVSSDPSAPQETTGGSVWTFVPLKQIEFGVYGELIIRYPKPYSIYLRGAYRCTAAEFQGSEGLRH